MVEALIEAADAHGVLQLGSKLRLGGAVRLMAGPFAEQIAILDKLDDSGASRSFFVFSVGRSQFQQMLTNFFRCCETAYRRRRVLRDERNPLALILRGDALASRADRRGLDPIEFGGVSRTR